MVRGKVTGSIWSTRRIDTLPKGALLEVMLANGTMVVAYDPIGCATNQEVLITQGSVAASFFPSSKNPIDAIIVGIIDSQPEIKNK
ncbi:MAG: EutN/CcmL family microcompartment protein [Methylacidiphilales bacterium]|nr:EutN/CcmL family microcompartment protein [Candidatus Methylacidiphilales bacterium]